MIEHMLETKERLISLETSFVESFSQEMPDDADDLEEYEVEVQMERGTGDVQFVDAGFACPASITVSLSAGEGDQAASAEITVTGLFTAEVGPVVDVDQFEALVASEGVNELYSQAKAYLSLLSAPGSIAGATLPSVVTELG